MINEADAIYEAITRIRQTPQSIPRYIVLHPTAWRSLLHARARIEARSWKRALRKKQTIRQRIQAIARRKQGRLAA